MLSLETRNHLGFLDVENELTPRRVVVEICSFFKKNFVPRFLNLTLIVNFFRKKSDISPGSPESHMKYT